MSRWLTALSVVLVVGLSQSHADYIMIKVDLQKLLQQNPNSQNPDGQPMPGAGNIGLPPGGAMGGFGGSFPPAGNIGNAGGFGGSLPPAGNIGNAGGSGQPPPMSNFGGSGQPPPMSNFGNAGGSGQFPPPAANYGNAGGSGQFPPGSGFPGMPNPPTKTEPESPQWVYAHIPVNKKPKLLRKAANFPPEAVEIDHQWGKKTIIPIKLIRAHYFDNKISITEEFNKRKSDMEKEGGSFADVRNLATWALRHGLLTEFESTMGILAKKDAKHPHVAAYLAVKTSLSKAPTADDPVNKQLISDLAGEGYRIVSSTKGFYSLMTKLKRNGDSQQEIDRRLQRMEHTLMSFYYWFALQDKGIVLPAPRHRLLAVLVENGREFNAKHAVWGKVHRAADGFTPRRENVMILSRFPLNEAYEMLAEKTQLYLQSFKLSQDELLTGDIWKRKYWKKQGSQSKVFPVALLQTCLLMKKAMEDESERTTITHEGTLQLLRTTGVLPRHVLVPQWVQSGFASLFETSYGAFYHQTALPNATYLTDFKRFQKKKKLDPSKEVLLKVVTDFYFEKAAETKKKLADAKGDKIKKLKTQLEEENRIARATSWAFVYYLVNNNKLRYLLQYCSALDQLPRDLELNKTLLQRLFGKSFGVFDPARPDGINLTRMQGLASTWFAEMQGVSLEIAEMEGEFLVRLDPPPPQKQPPGGQPGGFPGGYPGGFPGGFPGGQPGGGGIIPDCGEEPEEVEP